MASQHTVEINSVATALRELAPLVNQVQRSLEAVTDSGDGGGERELADVGARLGEVRGTLELLDLHGAALLSMEMRALASGLADDGITDRNGALERMLKAVLRLADYLDRIRAGQHDAPAVLLPLINELRTARNAEPLSQRDVFFPDLSRTPLGTSKTPEEQARSDVASDAAEAPPSTQHHADVGDVASIALNLRPRFRRALLGWYRGADTETHLARLGQVLHELGAASVTPSGQRLWGICGALTEALADQGLDADNDVKRLMARVERLLSRVSREGEEALEQQLPIELLRGLLYHVARSGSAGERVQAVREAYDLADALAAEHDDRGFAGPDRNLLGVVADGIREDIAAVKDAVEIHVHSEERPEDALEGIPQQIMRIADTFSMLGQQSAHAMLRKEVDTVTAIDQIDPAEADARLQALADTLLRLESDLDRLLAGETIDEADVGEMPMAGLRTLPASEFRALLSAVVAAALENLARVREALAAYCASPESGGEALHEAPELIDEVRGAVALLPLVAAERVLDDLRRYIQTDLIDRGTTPDADTQILIADVVAGLEYYLEAVDYDRAGMVHLLQAAERAIDALISGHAPTAHADDEAVVMASPEAEGGDRDDALDPTPDDPSASWPEGADDNDELDPGTAMDSLPELTAADPVSADDALALPPADGEATDLDDPAFELDDEPGVAISDDPAVSGDAADTDDDPTEFASGEDTDFDLDSIAFELDEDSAAADFGGDDVTDSATGVDGGTEQAGDAGNEVSDFLERELAGLSADLDPGFDGTTDDAADTRESDSPETDLPESDLPEPDLPEPGSEPDWETAEDGTGTGDDSAGEEGAWQDRAGEAPVEDENRTSADEDVAADADAADDAAANAADGATGSSRLVVLGDDVDEEIVEVYIEEALGELDRINEYLPRLQANPDDEDALVTIRRAFHTLKGGGRLIGAELMGEFSWSMENMLNRVLDRSIDPTDAVFETLDEGSTALPQLIEQLQGNRAPIDDIDALIARAHALSRGESGPPDGDGGGGDSGVGGSGGGGASSTDARPGSSPDGVQGNTDALSDDDALASDGDNACENDWAAGDDIAVGEQHSGSQLEPGTHADEESGAEFDPTFDEEFATEAAAPIADEQSLAAAEHGRDEDLELDRGGDGRDAAASEPGPESSPGSVPESESDYDLTLLDIFADEAAQHLAAVRDALPADPEGSGPQPVDESMMRALHTLHGSAQTAGSEAMVALAAPMERILKGHREQDTQVPPDELTLFREALEALEGIAGQLPDIADPAEVAELHTRLAERGEQLEQDQAASGEDNELVDIFIDEGDELVEACERAIQLWRDDPEATGRVMSDLQRNLHTLKGGARMANLPPIADLTHEIESLVNAINDGAVTVDTEVFELLQEAVDGLTVLLEQARGRQTVSRVDWLVDELRNCRLRKSGAGGAEAATAAPTPTADPDDAVTESGPDAAEAPGRESGQAAAPRAEATPGSDQIRVQAELLDNLVNFAGEVSIYHSRLGEHFGQYKFNLTELEQTVNRLREQLRVMENETESQILHRHEKESDSGPAREDFDPLEFDRYTRIQELSRSLAESVGDLDSIKDILDNLTRDSETLLLQQSRVSSDLQGGLMQTRMVRFDGLRARFGRTVRQTARAVGKNVELTMTGGEVEIDRSIQERILGPLEHILRNAVSHGVESSTVRKRAGKPETGTISMDLHRGGTDIIIEITDDGAGIDPDKVRRKAIDKGLIAADDDRSDNDVLQLILETGFSTADEVTQVAGRGVGMDVVDAELRRLGGTLGIQTEKGVGTRFSIRLPVTLAINQAVLVGAGEDTYAIPIASIEGVSQISAGDLREHYVNTDNKVRYAGNDYTLHHLGRLLGTSEPRLEHAQVSYPVVMVRAGDDRVALHVDQLVGRREVVVKPLGAPLNTLPGISGATIMADGDVVLILDVGGLLRTQAGVIATGGLSEERQEVAQTADEPAESATESDMPTVLIVDDSITIRKVTQRVLARNGLNVATAKDGVDAVSWMANAIPDLILLDIEMPRMDGYEVATYVRGEERLAGVPIIMITSRTGEKHRKRAEGIGVNEYLGKPYQEMELMDAIRQQISIPDVA